jgi:raffinose/stachyose/melibiose transport system permease protein
MTMPETTIEQQQAHAERLDPSGTAAYSGQRSLRRRLRRFPWHLFVFIGPALLIYGAFMVYPLFDTLRLSLYSDTGGWAGLTNFHTLFHDSNYAPAFWNALKDNFVFFAFHSLVQNPIALLLAVLLTVQGVRGQNVYRTLIFVPTVLSVVIIGFIWSRILSPLWDLPLVHTSAPLGSDTWSLPSLSLISVWQWVGIPMIFFYAVLIAIPHDVIEAARIDGAGSFRIFRSVTLPLILPMLGIITIVTFIANFNAFDLIYTVQGALAGPNFHTDILGTYFYRTFFGFQLQPGSDAMGATVASAMFLIILLGVLVYMFGWARRVRTYEF